MLINVMKKVKRGWGLESTRSFEATLNKAAREIFHKNFMFTLKLKLA